MKHAFAFGLAAVLTFVFASGLRADDAPADKASSDAKVKKLVSDGGYYYSTGAFDKATKCADDALKINPDSASAKQLKEMSAQAAKAKAAGGATAERERKFEETMARTAKDAVPQKEILRMPANWDEVKKREGGASGDGVKAVRENKAVNAQLDSAKVTADFNGTSLKEAAAFLATAGKVNIMVDPRAKVGDKPALEAEVTFKGTDMTLRHVLTWITRLNNLKFTVRDEVVCITDKEHLTDYMVTTVYDITDIVQSIPDYSSVPEFDVTLPAVNARRISDGFYRVPTFWDNSGMGVFTGAFFSDFAEQNRQFMTEEEVQDLVNKLIEAEDSK